MTEDSGRTTDYPSAVIRDPSSDGGVAQLGERLLCKQEVVGSIPITSTIQKTGIRNQTTDSARRDRTIHANGRKPVGFVL